MEITQNVIEFSVLVVGAALGAFKGVMAYGKDKSFYGKVIDVAVGAYVGIMLAKHYASEWNIWYASVLSLIAGASGAMIVDVILRLVPSLAKDIIKTWAQRFLEPK